jgi:hypothetical protein
MDDRKPRNLLNVEASPTPVYLAGGSCGPGVNISLADERPRDHGEREDHHGYVLDQRFHHNRYYPPRGFVVHALPPGFVTFRRPGGEFLFSDGIWYSRRGPDFLVVALPPGVTIAALPLGYTTVWVRGRPYYYANDVYYTQAPDGYAVVEAPSESDIVTTPPPGAAPQGAPPPQASQKRTDYRRTMSACLEAREYTVK